MNNINSNKKELSPEQREELLRALKARFEKNMNRHKGLEWAKVQAKLEAAMGIELLTPSLLIPATAMSSCITTVHNLTMAPGRSVAR
jgi:predicted nucleic acid-binding protein